MAVFGWIRGGRGLRAGGWYALGKTFKHSIEGRAALGAVVVDGRLVEVLNARTLLSSGCVKSREYRRGRAYMVTSGAALLACGRLDEFSRWLACCGGGRPLQRALRATMGGAHGEDARTALEKCGQHEETALDAAVAMAVILGDTERAARLAEQADLSPADSARLSGTVLGNASAARDSLTAAMGNSTGASCVELAHAWQVIVGEERLLRGYLEGQAPGHDRCAAAHAWWAVLDDRQRAVEALEAGVQRANSAADWMELAETWAVLFEDGEHTRRCLQASERLAASSDDWRRAAGCWSGCFGDVDAASWCLEMAEDEDRSLADRLHTARAYREFLGEGESARRSLRQFERGAGSALDWLLAARVWEGVPDGGSEIATWLDRAEGLARSDRERAAVARAWRDLLDQDGGEQGRTQ